MLRAKLRSSEFREMAEQLRAVADGIKSSPRAAVLRGVADDYDRMAAATERREQGESILYNST